MIERKKYIPLLFYAQMKVKPNIDIHLPYTLIWVWISMGLPIGDYSHWPVNANIFSEDTRDIQNMHIH